MIKEWLNEILEVFPEIKRKKIYVDYKKISSKRLGYVSAKIPRDYDLDPEALLLGETNSVRKKNVKPKEFKILINEKMNKIKNVALRKQIVQHILIHELLHIANEDLFTLSKEYNRRKKKKIHVNEFEEEVFTRFNKLRELKGIMQIQKREHLDIAIHRILESINWFAK
ncbi:MAG: hypothetical protein V1740_00470 [Candidatus Woesearchaeota archaeon]